MYSMDMLAGVAVIVCPAQPATNPRSNVANVNSGRIVTSPRLMTAIKRHHILLPNRSGDGCEVGVGIFIHPTKETGAIVAATSKVIFAFIDSFQS